MMKNKIIQSDFKLRLFVDTNILIDYAERFNKGKSVTFLKLFERSEILKKSKIEEVELVTSDYVLWEFYGHTKEELYTKKLVEKNGYGFIAANKECRNANFRNADPKSMKQFGNKIKDYLRELEEDKKIIYIERLMGGNYPKFSEIIDTVLQYSKFPYKDAIVLVSAQFTGANAIVTRDEQHFGRNHIEELKEAMGRWKINPGRIEIKKPSDLDTLEKIRLEYKKWFAERNKNKIIGDVVIYYSKRNVIKIKCREGCIISEEDSLYLVNFFHNKIVKFWFKVPKFASGNFKNAKTKKAIKKGNYVTIKLSSKFSYRKKRWKDAWIFLAE